MLLSNLEKKNPWEQDPGTSTNKQTKKSKRNDIIKVNTWMSLPPPPFLITLKDNWPPKAKEQQGIDFYSKLKTTLHDISQKD